MEKITIDPLALLEVKYLDMTHGKALTLGEVIALKQQRKFNPQMYTSVNELVGDKQFRKPVLPDTRKLSDDMLDEHGIYWKELPQLPTPRQTLSTESNIDLDRTGVKVSRTGQWDLDYKVLNKPSSYRPAYTNTLADPTTMRIAVQTLAMVTFGNPDVKEYVEYSVSRLIEFAETHFYGNGSAQGQVRRLVAVMDVSKAAIKALKAAKEQYGDLKFGVSVEELSKYLPLKERTVIKQPTLRDTLTNNLDKSQPTMNQASEEGLPFKPQVKRADCLLYEALTLNRLLSDLHTGPKGWGGLARMKPKAEVYKLTDLENKTRNIFVLNGGQSSILSMYINHVNKLVKDTALSNTNHSLLKRPALTTMASEFVDRMLAMKKNNEQMVCLTYSDNIFVFSYEDGVLTSTSLDGAKMEGTNVSATMVSDFVNYTLHPDDPLKPLITEHAQRCINSYAQLGESLLYVPGMLSGTPMTTLLNTYRMGLMACSAEKAGVNSLSDLIKHSLTHGLSLTTERSFTMDEVEDLWENPTSLDHIGSYLDADLLGFSIGCVRINGKQEWVSILDHDRLCKSMCFNKLESNQRYKGPIMLLIRYITFCTLYTTGGWYYPGTAQVLKAACIDMVETINQLGKRLPMSLASMFDIINSVTSDLGLDRTAVQALTSSMLVSTIPTLETILKIVTNGTITGDDIVHDLKLKGLESSAHLLVNVDTFRNSGITATPEQVQYYSRHGVFKPKVFDEVATTPQASVTLPSNPQKKGIKRPAPKEVETEQPAAKKLSEVPPSPPPMDVDDTSNFEPIF